MIEITRDIVSCKADTRLTYIYGRSIRNCRLRTCGRYKPKFIPSSSTTPVINICMHFMTHAGVRVSDGFAAECISPRYLRPKLWNSAPPSNITCGP